ncbi:NADAR family protein [Enterovibrio calviensis]|uniref:NADAR family protein n=1 Tax=Enterovibrio calviensis TaxID=91359 RepID=UPI003735C0A0
MTNTICFYEPDEAYGFLSNFYGAPLRIDGKAWLTSEHYYQACKFESMALQQKIQCALTPDEAFSLSREFNREVKSDWLDIRCDVMRHVVGQKFQQHADLALKLASTYPADLVECSHCDAFWGTGKSGDGLNKLGHILMDVRHQILVQDVLLSNPGTHHC